MYTRVKTAVAAALLLGVGAVHAQTSIDTALATFSGEADLVFQGTVTGIQYANSVEGIPHTFVTYRVEDVVKGSYSAPSLTLRFVGGEKKDANGEVVRLSVSHSPRFAAGQQDLLMVKGNGSSQCPLVKCAEGRFRLEQGIVKTEHGDVLAREAQGGILALRGGDEHAAPGDFGAREAAEQRVAATPFDRASFVAHLRELAGRQGARGGQVRSADVSQAFKGPEAAVAPAPRDASRVSAPAPRSEQDRLEMEALTRNGGNPVLPQKDMESIRRAANR